MNFLGFYIPFLVFGLDFDSDKVFELVISDKVPSPPHIWKIQAVRTVRIAHEPTVTSCLSSPSNPSEQSQ